MKKYRVINFIPEHHWDVFRNRITWKAFNALLQSIPTDIDVCVPLNDANRKHKAGIRHALYIYRGSAHTLDGCITTNNEQKNARLKRYNNTITYRWKLESRR